MFHVLNLMSIFCCLSHSKESVEVQGTFCKIFVNMQVSYSEELYALPYPQPKATPCFLYVTAYLIYSQLSSISGDHLLHPQP
jgi:hypothetical protein